MKTFFQFLLEASGQKLLHLEHLEDEVLNGGKNGIRSIYNFLTSLRDMLAGNHNANAIITTKWDGAPAIAAGQDPATGKFFVAYKSMKQLNFTVQDVEQNFADKPALVAIYSNLLTHLKKLNIKNIVLQGDVLWSNPNQLSEQTIDGVSYITFKPNTITYAVPSSSMLAKRIKKAKVGIVFHTSFPLQGAKHVDDLSANFGADITGFKEHSDVFVTSAEFSDVSAKATFTKQDTLDVNMMLKDFLKAYKQLNLNYLNTLAANKNLVISIKAFINGKIRQGEFIDDSDKNFRLLYDYLKSRYQADIDKVKRAATKELKTQQMNVFLMDLESNATNLKNIFKVMAMVNNIKTYMIRKLEEVKSLTNTFVKDEMGFKVTKPEGFVAIDKNDKTRGIKLVDRLEFSRANFNIAKTWDK